MPGNRIGFSRSWAEAVHLDGGDKYVKDSDSLLAHRRWRAGGCARGGSPSAHEARRTAARTRPLTIGGPALSSAAKNAAHPANLRRVWSGHWRYGDVGLGPRTPTNAIVRVKQIDGCELLLACPFFKEFALKYEHGADVAIPKAAAAGVDVGPMLSRFPNLNWLPQEVRDQCSLWRDRITHKGRD